MLTVKFGISDHPERLEEKIDIDIIEDEISFFIFGKIWKPASEGW